MNIQHQDAGAPQSHEKVQATLKKGHEDSSDTSFEEEPEVSSPTAVKAEPSDDESNNSSREDSLQDYEVIVEQSGHADDEEPEILLTENLVEVKREKPLTDPISIDVKIEPQNDEVETPDTRDKAEQPGGQGLGRLHLNAKRRLPTPRQPTMTNRPSYAQVEGLVEFLEQNPGIGKGLLRTSQGKLETKRKWEQLAPILNSLGGVNKNGQGWAKYWAEKKCALKKLCAAESASLITLSAFDRRLVAVMGGQEYATGDPGLTVNPIPQQTRPVESPVVIIKEDTEMDNNSQNISPIPGTSHNDAIPASSSMPAPPTPLDSTTRPRLRRRRSSIPRPVGYMERFTSIETRRVEAEVMTAQALVKLTEEFGNIAIALTSIANAISDVAGKMPNP